MGSHVRAVQLMATLAAVEILAAHPRVDESRMGTTGVSLGGRLAVQTAPAERPHSRRRGVRHENGISFPMKPPPMSLPRSAVYAT